LELSELRQMSAGDLAVKEREAREEVFRLRLKLRTSQLDNSGTLRTARRELARILTVIGEKTPAPGRAAGAKEADAGAN
jgi:large subunit ribosomal protein L29